ncbi:protein virilizer [Venturia canescens]|uniref:protein virilizer n=1 Tax=Venturia canescens TaxID=32260 RepID=UPI001C9CA4EE|nr:protein virilizer [Venturia canescens]
MDNIELLFFDTFSHDISEELNLDLVQFPKPVYISEVRIIPLGARVQADFPGGVRLGATNPSQFEIEFFVNDLSKPGASTFESLGGLEYKQNVHIQLECERKQIPTDGLVLRGWYTTITLAVYGSLTKSLSNPQESTGPSATVALPVGSSEPAAESVSQAPEPQPDWYFENSAPVPTVNQETSAAQAPSPTIQQIQTVEPTQRLTPVEPAKPEPARWSGEEVQAGATAPRKPAKRPSSPPSESLVSLSPESISAEEEEDRVEREVEEPPSVAVEPFEPILSDEELMADDVPSTSVDYQCETLQGDNLYAIKPPELLDLEKFPASVFHDAQNHDETALEKIREIIRSLVKSTTNFNAAPGQEKETFVHSCESLCSLLGSVNQLDSEDLRDWTEIVNASLDLDLARGQPQPAYKVRHVKVGVRLAEASCSLVGGPEILLKVSAPKKLLTLCMRENVALPVKLAALRALDASLLSPKIVEEFLKSDNNLYRLTLEMLDEAKLARLKYALTSMLRKIHVYELLEASRDPNNMSELALNELTQTYVCAPTLMAQPKRQLPASKQMEFGREQSRNPRRHLIAYFEHHGLARRLLLALTSPSSDRGLVAATRKFLMRLANTGEGLLYLLSQPEVSRSILRAMRYEKPGPGCVLAWRLQVMQCLVQLKNQQPGNSSLSNDWWLPLRKLHTFLIYPEGLQAVIAVLPLNGFIDYLMPYLSDPDLVEFAAEIISVTVRYSERVEIIQTRASAILEEARNNGTLRDIVPHLTVAGQSSNWNYGDVTSLVGTVRKYAEKAASLPGELLTACRILHYLVFPSNTDMDPFESYLELKHRNALTQLFAADGLTALVSVLSKIAHFYEQPHLHRASLNGRRGLALIALLLPCVKLVRALIERLVKCMATDFKDLTAVAPLLGVWALVEAIPDSSSSLRYLADEIAETLLAFTRAVDSDGAGNVAKSLWTQMIGEVLKMISACPANFVPGLRLLSRLLPPIFQLDETHPNEEITRAMGLRKLWSAHLQAQVTNLTETLCLLCASWDETLLNLLSNVCKQISDLAAPSALVVGRCLLDRILAATPLENNSPVLALLADLAMHAPLKATLLTLLSPTSRAQVKSDQKYPPVVDTMCATLKTTNFNNVQLEILDTFNILCDDKLSLVQDENSSEPFEIRLTHSVPSKDPLLSILAALIDVLANAPKYSNDVLESDLRILVSLTRHNYGLYHVKSCLENNPGALRSLLEHVSGRRLQKVEPMETEFEDNALESLIVSFLENLVSCKNAERSLYLRVAQLASLLSWDKSGQHPLEKFKGAQELVEKLRTSVDGKDEKDAVPEMLEPLLPTPDTLLNQFSQRSLGHYGRYSRHTRKRTFVDSSTTGNNDVNNTVDLLALAAELLPTDFNLLTEAQLLCSRVPPDDSTQPIQPKGRNEGPEDSRDSQKQTNVPTAKTKQPFVTPMRGRAQFVNSMRSGSTAGGAGRGADPFRSRPPNTSRPPSLHVDDFVALETCGAQPTGPTGYNKLSIRGTCPPRGVIAGTRCRSWVSEPRSPYLR